VIRFGAVLSVVLIAIGLLVTGVVTSSLLLVYLAIGVAALAGLMLLIGVLIWRTEIFGSAATNDRAAQGKQVAELAATPQLTSPRPAGPASQPQSAAPADRAEPPVQVVASGSGRSRAAHAARSDRPTRQGKPAGAESNLTPDRGEAEVAAERDRSGRSEPAVTPDRSRPRAPAASAEPAAAPSPGPELRRTAAAGRPARTEVAAEAVKPASAAPAAPGAGQPMAADAGIREQAAKKAAGPATGAPAERKPDRRASSAQVPVAAASTGGQAPARTGGPAAGGADRAVNGESRAEPDLVGESSAGSAGPAAAAVAAAAAAAEEESPAASTSTSDTVKVVPGITRYHRSDCILIRFLTPGDLESMTREAATEGGCVPCRACQPDKAPAGVAAD